MVTSPIVNGVVLIGGKIGSNNADYHELQRSEEYNDFIELSGDSICQLKWTKLDQKLQYKRYEHVAFPISNEAFSNLIKKKTRSVSSSSRIREMFHAMTKNTFAS